MRDTLCHIIVPGLDLLPYGDKDLGDKNDKGRRESLAKLDDVDVGKGNEKLEMK